MNEVFKPLGLLVLVIMSAATIWVVRKNGVHMPKSISQHAGLAEHTFVRFGLASTAAIVLLYVFMQEWFIPVVQPPALFTYAIVAGLACQLVAAWVPHAEEPLAARIHNVFAYTMAGIMPVALVLLLFSADIPEVGKWIAGVAALIMTAEYLLFRLVRGMAARYFLYQSVYILLFYVAVLGVAYIDF